MADEQKPVSYKDSLNLPRTSFPIRPARGVEEEQLLQRWSDEKLYERAYTCNQGSAQYVLHDGPPYTNGHIHLGHAYNKILKDMLTKSRRMTGKHVPVKPGWDCHGLPIELKVSQEHPGLSPLELIKKCREYARQWIDVQRAEFKKLGVVMDWENPYITMSHSYEAAIVRSFKQFVEQNFIQKKNKTVPWCMSCQTVLATAEIDYKERKDPSVYVLFTLPAEVARRLHGNESQMPVHLLVWTTTPWTLPLNRAVALRPDTSYSLCRMGDTCVVIGTSLVDSLRTKLAVEVQELSRFNGDVLTGVQVQHPFIPGFNVPIIFDQMVTLDDGTACVHCAPGCGAEDYEAGLKNGLEIFSAVSPSGHYMHGIQPVELEGMSVTDGQWWVLKQLEARGTLFHKTSLKHQYPHCWRCRNGLIFRATKQWFCDLSQHHLKERALNALETMQFLPRPSGNSLRATVDGRLEWCLSRQRIWGVPIPAICCTKCGESALIPSLVDAVAEGIEQQGVEFWRLVNLSTLLPAGYACRSCENNTFEKEYDILDVWFDSGISHYAVLRSHAELSFPADCYLEGRDQARGWFQSSLLTSMVLEGRSCTSTIITHGYTVDGSGQKMSKSLGNVVSPQEVIERIGVDGLRLWVASIDYENDAVVSDVLLNNVAEVFRKIRNTARFLLSNLYDFNPATDAISFDDLLFIDRYALGRLYQFESSVRAAYESADFTAVYHALTDYCATELSALYLDVIKDRLYVERAAGRQRRSAQTVCYHILDIMTRLMAPIMSFTAEQLSDLYQTGKDRSIHLQQFSTIHPLWLRLEADWSDASWDRLFAVRSAILKSIELLRQQGIIKHPLEASVRIAFDSTPANAVLQKIFDGMRHAGQSFNEVMKELCVVSQCVEVPFDSIREISTSELAGVAITVERIGGTKCPRCWQYTEAEAALQESTGLCVRCSLIVT
jgi:isoleucyl-tRNA synthetase